MATPEGQEHTNMVLQREVARVFEKRRWSSLEAAEIATGVSASTIGRMRKGMSVGADKATAFAAAIGEREVLWALYASGFTLADVEEVAGKTRPLTDDEEKMLSHASDPVVKEVVARFTAVPEVLKTAALAALAGLASVQTPQIESKLLSGSALEDAKSKASSETLLESPRT